MKLTHTKIDKAISQAKKLAAAGPRVAAVLESGGKFGAVPGYMDSDGERVSQVALVTPDGRVWRST